MFDVLYRYDFTYQFTKLAQEEKKALKVLHGFTDSIINSRREELVKKGKSVSEIDGKPLNNSDIREEVDTFVFEGHDTTSSAIMFFFYNIANYPETQKKCFEEIVEVFGTDKNATIGYEELSKLHYIDLCVKETLRMFPSVPILGRKVNEECELIEPSTLATPYLIQRRQIVSKA
uniref:Cytochrome P450 n=1 Tax=Megaselia scalaris TaxID=36166 RepID=T1GKH9_MEGSC